MRIVILTSESPGNIWLVNRILSEREVAGIVVERRPLALAQREKIERRRRLVRRYGLGRTLNKLLYNKLRMLMLAPHEAREIREHFFPGGVAVDYQCAVPTEVVASVNDEACKSFIRKLAPDLLAVCGTGVVKPEVFGLAPQGAINIHTGITPEYKSADPVFWALFRGEPEKVGVTVHFVDEGIDTGPIIFQQRVPVFGSDSLAAIGSRCIRHGAELYLRALRAIEDGSVRIMARSGAESRSFRSIDLGLTEYLRFRWRWRRLARRLPPGDGEAAQVGGPDQAGGGG